MKTTIAKYVLHDPKMWNETFAKFPLNEHREEFVLKVMKEYARLACEKQRQICADIVNSELPQNLAADECRIAPEPDLK